MPWELSTLHNFTGDPDNPSPAPFRQMGVSDDGYLYMPYGNPARIKLADFSQHFGTPNSSQLFALGSQFLAAFAGAPGGVLYAIARTNDTPLTPQVFSWTEAGGWVHLVDLDIGWELHSIARGRDGNLYVLERRSPALGFQWMHLAELRFTPSTTWTYTGTGWTTSVVGQRLRPRYTSVPPATDLTITWPRTIVPLDPTDSFAFKIGVTPIAGGGTVTVQLTRDGVPWGTPASTNAAAAITATGSNPGAGHVIGAVITVHQDGTGGTGLDQCELGFEGFGYGLLETGSGGPAQHRAVKITPGGVATTLTALDYSSANLNDYRHITADAHGVVWISMDNPPVGSPYRGVSSVLRRYDGSTVTDVPIQALVDPSHDLNTEARGGLYCDSRGNIIVPMIRHGAGIDQSWFLSVGPDGTARTIVGSFGGSTPSSIADADEGWGMSLDGKTLYFFDGTSGNLLRQITLLGVNRPYGPPLESTTVIPSVPLAVAGQRQRVIAVDESTAVRTGGEVIPTAGHPHIEPLSRVPVPDDQLDDLINGLHFPRDWPPEHLLPAEITAYSDDFGLDASWTDWMARVDDSRWLTIDGGQATYNQPVGPMIMKLWGWNGRGTPDEPAHVELLDEVEISPASDLNGRFITASLGDGEHFALYHHLSGVDGRTEESLRLNGTLLAANHFASGDPWDTDVYHPTPGALLLATVFQYGGTGPPSLFGNSLSWVLVESVGYNLTGVQMWVFRAMSPTATPGQLTVYGMSAARGMVHVCEFTGADTSGSAGSGAIVQHEDDRADESAGKPSATSLTVTLSSPTSSQDNVTFAAFNNEIAEPITPGGDYTQLGSTIDPDLSIFSDDHAMITEWATRGLRDADASASGVTRWEGIAVEIKKGTPVVIENTLEYRLFSIVNDRIVWDTDFLRWMPDPLHGTGQNYEALVWLDQDTLAYFAVIYPPFGPETLYVNVMDSSGQTLRIDHVTGTATTGVVGSGIASFIVAPRSSKAVYVTYDTYGGFGATTPVPWQVEWTLAGGFGVIERLDSDVAGILERPFNSGHSIFTFQGRSTSNGASTTEVGAGYGSAFATLFLDVIDHDFRGFILREELNFVGPDTIYNVRSPIFTVGSLMSACQTGIVAVAPFYWEIMSPEGLLFQINEDDVYERFPNFVMDLAVLLNEGAMVAYGQLLHRAAGLQPPFEFRTSVESWRTGRGITTVAGQQRRLNRIGPPPSPPGVLA